MWKIVQNGHLALGEAGRSNDQNSEMWMLENWFCTLEASSAPSKLIKNMFLLTFDHKIIPCKQLLNEIFFEQKCPKT